MLSARREDYRITGQADSRTTKLYDRRGQKVLIEDMRVLGRSRVSKAAETYLGSCGTIISATLLVTDADSRSRFFTIWSNPCGLERRSHGRAYRQHPRTTSASLYRIGSPRDQGSATHVSFTRILSSSAWRSWHDRARCRTVRRPPQRNDPAQEVLFFADRR